MSRSWPASMPTVGSGPGLVIDASALVYGLLGTDSGADAVRTRIAGTTLHAPHLIHAEVGNVLRRHERAGKLSAVEGAMTLGIAGRLVRHLYPHTDVLAQDAWALRGNLSFYDALYVALAARLGLALLTCDNRLANAPGITCVIEVV